jgi:hypothetical protein
MHFLLVNTVPAQHNSSEIPGIRPLFQLARSARMDPAHPTQLEDIQVQMDGRVDQSPQDPKDSI